MVAKRETTDEMTEVSNKEPEQVEIEASADDVEKPAKKRRGRPKKSEAEDSDVKDSDHAKDKKELSEEPEKKTKRSRSKKKATDDAAGSENSANSKNSNKDVTSEDTTSEDAAPENATPEDTTPDVVDTENTSDIETSSSSQPEEDPEIDASENSTSEDTSSSNEEDAADQTDHRHARQHRKSDSQQKQNQDRQNQKGARNQNGRSQNQHRRMRQRDNRQREYTPSIKKEDLEALKLPELREKAAELNIDASGMKKAEMIDAIYEAVAIAEGFVEVQGILDIISDGYGFLRTKGYLPGETDVYVSLSTIRRNGLRKGDLIVGQTRPSREGDKFAAIQKVFSVNGVPIDELSSRPKFSELTPVYPDERLLMEHGADTLTARVVDLVAPIGKGQRGLIVSPPKAGKTTVLKDIAASIHANNPEVHLMCLLVDERPEEVTDMERSVHGEVISSTFDMPSENHIAVSELVIERAKRLVEQGEDVVILLDSITRLARAYNLAQPASGRILSGGVDSTALYPPKRFLGAARNIEGGGSLTILASALVDTGSKMDEVIFEEFKGTGNMELKLDRNLADRRIFPAIDPVASGTRKEELLMNSQEAPLIWAVRRILANMNNTERSMDMLIKSLKKTDNNQEFLLRTAKRAQSQSRSEDNLVL